MVKVILKPYGKENIIDHMIVNFEISEAAWNEGEELCAMQLSTVTIPGCDAENFFACDEIGELEVETSYSQPYPYSLKHWKTLRKTQGMVTVSYTVRPRILDEKAVCGPYFDFRCEDNGANSAGISFLARFDQAEGIASLHWDLSEMPKKSRGVCTFGEGDVQVEGGLELLRQSYYAMGDIKSVSEGEFGFYWLSEPSFDVDAVAKYIKDLFVKMQMFFKDSDPVYRIFVRKDPFKSSGGTALHRSYMFGWNETQSFTVEERQFILAHEMVHNWPHLNDNPYGITTWYSEGTAEYYSVMLPLRMGLLSPQKAMEEIQRRTDNYYTNPTRFMENMEAAKICWQDRRAQRLAYGRGFIFLANVDVQIRKATNNVYSLDDVMLDILEKSRRNEELGNEVFLAVVKKISGLDVTNQWEQMKNGGHIVPLAECFDGYYTVEEKYMPEADTGVEVVSYQWKLKP